MCVSLYLYVFCGTISQFLSLFIFACFVLFRFVLFYYFYYSFIHFFIFSDVCFLMRKRKRGGGCRSGWVGERGRFCEGLVEENHN